MTLAARTLSTAVNHLLTREPWARTQLAGYAGKTLKLVLPAFTLALSITEEGSVAPAQPPQNETAAGADDTAQTHDDVTIAVAIDALSAFAQGGQAAALKHVRIAGDAEFAALIARLAEQLRWEPEEDLADLLGDAPAHQLSQGARAAWRRLQRNGRNLVEALADYWLDEDPQLVRHTQLERMGDEVALLRDALARLEKRVERLERTRAPGLGVNRR